MSLTFRASSDILYDILSESRPPVGPLYQVCGATDSWMTVGWRIMAVMNELSKVKGLSGDHQSPVLPPFSINELQLVRIDPLLDGLFILPVFFVLQLSREHFIGQDYYPFVVLFSLTVIWPSRQSVSLPVGASFEVVNFDVIVSKLKHFPSHTSADLLGVPPVLQVHVVGEYFNFVGAPRQEGPPVSQHFDNGQQLQVVDVVVPFCGSER